MNEFPNSETLLVFDGDLICYQKGFKHEKTEEWYIVEHDIDSWIAEFFEKFGTYNYIIYLTGKNNFREQAAVSHPYKGQRTKPKPKWHGDIRKYLVALHSCKVVEGYEADDEIAMHLTRNKNAIHIGIDKDLWQVEGWHYRFATHNSPEIPLRYITHEGSLELTEKKKLVGTGMKWFYAQMLIGDRTDNIFGVPRCGDIGAYNALKECETEKECYDVVKEKYEAAFENPEERLIENANLLYMIREKRNGELVKWQAPEA